MSNELLVIEQANAVAVLSTDDGIKTLLENVRANIDNMDGGSMKNKSSRAKIRSNAFKATKAYTKINGETIEPLIASLTAKIQPQLNVINAIKENQSVLKSGLQQIRKDVNEDVDAFEAELQRIEDEKVEIERVATVDRDREFAMMMYSEYLAQVALGESILADWKKAADEKIETDRITHEKQIAADAAEAARLKAENNAAIEKKRLEDEKQAAIDLAETNKQLAIQADLDSANLREEMRIDYHKRMIKHIVDCGNGWIGGQPQPFVILFRELEEKVIIDDSFEEFKGQAETAKINAIANLNRLQDEEKTKADDVEKLRIKQEKQQAEEVKQAGVDAANKVESDRIAEEKRTNDAAIQRAKNQDHSTAVMTQTKESIMALGVPEEFAILVTKGLRVGSVTNVGKIQF